MSAKKAAWLRLTAIPILIFFVSLFVFSGIFGRETGIMVGSLSGILAFVAAGIYTVNHD